MADDYGSMLDNIALETRRPRATFGTRIEQCVQEAIDDVSRARYPWNQSRANTFSTVASQEIYTSSDASWIDDILEFDAVTVTISSTDKRPLCSATFVEIEEWNSDGTTTGQPTHYCYWGETLRIYPIPDAVYVTRVAGLFALTRLSADVDTNAWVVRGKGEALIRASASAKFYGRYLRDADQAAVWQNIAAAENDRCLASLSRRQGDGRIRPNF